MPDSMQKKGAPVSSVERLRSTDKFLAEMRSVLSSMDEIDGLRRQRGEAISDEFGGYKRSSVVKLIEGLEKQRESILRQIEQEERELSLRAREEAAARKRAEEQNAARQEARLTAVENSVRAREEAAKRDEEARRNESPVASFRRGDASLALESMYTGLSMDIEKLRDDILQELRYTYKQDMAIYDDLSALIESRKMDKGVLDESLRPLQEKLDTLAPVDYEQLADQVAEKVLAGGIDYDVLAHHIVAIMNENAPAPAALPAPVPAETDLSAMERKLDEMQNLLQGVVSVRQMPEFRKLDALTAEYARTQSYELIPDILVAADAAKLAANRYIENGNALRGETMLSDIRTALAKVVVHGSLACTAVADAVSSHNLAVTYSPDAMEAFRQACVEFEQSSAIPQDEIAARLHRAKYALLGDSEADASDVRTMTKMFEAREGVHGVPDQAQIDTFNGYKRELMSFDLSHFVDLTPPLPAQQNANGASADTQAILDAIARLNLQPRAAEPAAAAPAAPAAEPALAQGVAQRASVKKPRTLRPAVSAKDNKLEKTDQPLRVVKRKIDLTSRPEEGLTRKVVEDLAVRIANSRVK